MNTTILVHGFKDNASRMARMAGYLSRRGFVVFCPTLSPSGGEVPLEELAAQLASYIKEHGEDSKINLIGYSMGGLICRYYLQRMGGLAKTEKFIAIATPNRGTITATIFGGAGLKQMRPSSAFLKDLNSDVTMLQQVECTTIRTPFDLTILPGASTKLPFARSFSFPVAVHHMLVYHRPVWKKIEELLT